MSGMTGRLTKCQYFLIGTYFDYQGSSFGTAFFEMKII